MAGEIVSSMACNVSSGIWTLFSSSKLWTGLYLVMAELWKSDLLQWIYYCIVTVCRDGWCGFIGRRTAAAAAVTSNKANTAAAASSGTQTPDAGMVISNIVSLAPVQKSKHIENTSYQLAFSSRASDLNWFTDMFIMSVHF